jgi:hypothetical protein
MIPLLPPIILLFVNTDVSTTKMSPDTSILAKSIMSQKKYIFKKNKKNL